MPKFKDIACGFCRSFAIDESGNAWGWGGGALGFKDVINNIIFRNILKELLLN